MPTFEVLYSLHLQTPYNTLYFRKVCKGSIGKIVFLMNEIIHSYTLLGDFTQCIQSGDWHVSV